MPSTARKDVVRKGEVGIYHCTAKCVRGAYLLTDQGGNDEQGDHRKSRKKWVIERIKLLVRCFAIDVGFDAIMENHLHLVLRVLPTVVEKWSDYEVVRRWLSVYPGYRIYDEQWHVPTDDEIARVLADPARVELLRERLSDVSWFMAAFSEYVARRANREDGCQGAFWDGRFDCREVVGEAALLICGIYVDLNQIRAGVVDTPEASQDTSVGLRITAHRAHAVADALSSSEKMLGHDSDDKQERLASLAERADWLAPLTFHPDQPPQDQVSDSGKRCSDRGLLSMTLEQYLQLIDHFGRLVRPDKRGAIPKDLAPILERLTIDPSELGSVLHDVPTIFRRFVGTASDIKDRAATVGRKWFHGLDIARRLFANRPQTVAKREHSTVDDSSRPES